MFFHLILLVISVMTFLASSHEPSCDQNCADKPQFTPSRLVVQFGKPTSALCSVCQPGCNVTTFGIESPVGSLAKNGTEITWTVDEMTEWINSLSCYYINDTTFLQCCSDLNITVYKPPENVSFSVHPDVPMSEGQQYTLQCEVRDVAPVANLRVTFYRGRTALVELKTEKDEAKPVSEVFTWNITSTKEDDGVQFWCEAKLELGAEGPQPPPVVGSEKLTAAVHYKPQLEASVPPDPIIITEGNPLTLNCSSVGNPSPSYIWRTSGITSPSSGSVFIIKSITHEEEGSYTCSVSNEKGSITVEFNVTVQDLELPSTTLPATTTSTPPTTMITTTSTPPTTMITTTSTPPTTMITTTSTPPTTMITTTSTPPTTMITTTSTPPTTMITTTSTPTTTKTTTTTTTTTTTPNRGTSSKRLHSFMMCFLLLFSALV
ncbi:hypothetical protein OYC64_016437 [Pagothenia borchgrevinki]|uniref:Ig-like domain-containing protein n=1 Tax=Pagothenia borchgrevinki TaxID=8213 RepID=A0ABD2HJ22_PAGBO